jgi:hypothetical protein
MLVVIATDCTGSCKSNYHTITITTTMTAIKKEYNWESTMVKQNQA